MVAPDTANGFARCLKVLIAAGLPIVLVLAGPLTAQERRNDEDSLPRAGIYEDDAVPEAPALPNVVAASADYVIGPEDILKIDVFEVRELSNLEVRVANDGTISLALLGHVPAAGFTTKQLREQLESMYAERYLEKPQVSVFIREFHAQPVSVIGAVERPGLYQLTGPRTLIQVLSLAGGLTENAGRAVLITRKGDFGDLQPVEGIRQVAPDKVEVSLRRLLYSEVGALNIEIKPFDIVSVSKAPIIYVVGEVKKPGGFVLDDREGVTVLQALALAEGLRGNPAKRKARIIRRHADGSRTEIPLDLGRILNAKSQDVEMAANDILFVPTSAGKAGVKRGVEAAIGTLSWLIIYGRL